MIGWFQLKWGGGLAMMDMEMRDRYEISGHNSAGVSSVYKITTTNKTVHFVVMQSLLTILFLSCSFTPCKLVRQFQVTTGVRYGCIPSPLLFATPTDWVMTLKSHWTKWSRYRLDGRHETVWPRLRLEESVRSKQQLGYMIHQYWNRKLAVDPDKSKVSGKL